MSSSNSIKQGAIISYVSIFLNIAIGLLYTPWMIKEIGVSDYGIYALIISFISYFLIDFGLGSSIARFISKYRAEGNENKVGDLLGITTQVYLLIDLIIVALLVVSYFFISNIFVKLTLDEIDTLKKVYLIAGFFSVCNFIFKPMDGAMMAYEYFVRLKSLDMIRRLGTVVLIVVVLLLDGGLYELVFINGAVALIVSIMKYRYFIKRSEIKIKLRYFDKVVAKQLFVFSFWVFMIGLAQRFRLSLMPSVLGAFSGTSEITIFSVAMTLEGFVYTIAFALNGLFIPKVSRLVQKETDRSKITALMVKVGRIQLYIIGFIIIGYIGLGKSFMQLWLGIDFANSYYVAALLIIPNIVILTQQIGGTLSYVENELKYNALIMFFVSVVSFVFSILFAEKYGAIGCGVANFVALVFYIILVNVFYKKILKLNVVLFFKSCHLKILPIMILFPILLFYIDKNIEIDSWIKLFGIGSIYAFAFIISMYFFAFNKEEKEIVSTVFNRLKNRI